MDPGLIGLKVIGIKQNYGYKKRSKLILGLNKIFGRKKDFGRKNNFGSKDLGPNEFCQKKLGSKTFWVCKIVGQKRFFVQKFFGSKSIVGQTNFWVSKDVRSKKFLVPNSPPTYGI